MPKGSSRCNLSNVPPHPEAPSYRYVDSTPLRVTGALRELELDFMRCALATFRNTPLLSANRDCLAAIQAHARQSGKSCGSRQVAPSNIMFAVH